MKKLIVRLLILFSLLTCGCADTTKYSTGVYMLMDTSGTYTNQLAQAQTIIRYLLGTLQSGDSLAVARIDSGSFSEKDIIAKMTFDQRPSVANRQKLHFKETVEKFVAGAKSSSHTDITGGVLQAVEYLDETKAGKKNILIFSDLEEDLAKGHIRDLSKIDLNLTDYHVVALNVTKLGSDQIDPKKYYDRLASWEKTVTDRGGNWKKINDLKRLDSLLTM